MGGSSTGDLSRVSLRPATPGHMKIARQRHKNQNFEKNGTYVKDNGVLRMPTNFFDNPFGRRMAQKSKMAIFVSVSAGRQYARGILVFFGPCCVPGPSKCRDVEDKGSI